MDTTYISEIFYSVQGEGILTGVPSVFIRTSGCNLRCAWCDTPYTSWEATGESLSLAEIEAAVRQFPAARHIVLTGGEPMLATNVGPLTRRLRELGYHITLETAGTVFTDVAVDLFSISPKLSGSTPGDEAGAWRQRHEESRNNQAVIARMMAAAPYQLKFVIATPEDLDEVLELVRRLQPDEPSRVLLMPQGRTVEELDRAAPWLVEVCRETGFRYCDRLHIRLFGNRRGT
jgi:7-carboxy-7-deazaguanine synthase